MLSLSEDRCFFEDAVIGSYDSFMVHVNHKEVNHDNVYCLIFNWNCDKLSEIISYGHANDGLELTCKNRLFVIARNPKINRNSYAWRCTNYINLSGPLCEELHTSLEIAIIDVFLSYPDAKLTNGVLDEWFKFFKI